MKLVDGRFQANLAVLALDQHSMVSQDVGCHVGFVVALEGAVVARAVSCSILRGRVVGINFVPGRARHSLLFLAHFSEADSSMDFDCVPFKGYSASETKLAFVALSVGPDLEFIALGEGDSLSLRVELLIVLSPAKDRLSGTLALFLLFVACASIMFLESGLVREAHFAVGALEARVRVVVALGDRLFDGLDYCLLDFFLSSLRLFWLHFDLWLFLT